MAIFQRRHYVWLAKHMNQRLHMTSIHGQADQYRAIRNECISLSYALTQENSQFKRAAFLKACGVED